MVGKLGFAKSIESHILFTVYKESVGKFTLGKGLVDGRKRTAEILVRLFNVDKRDIVRHMLTDRVGNGFAVADYHSRGQTERGEVFDKLVDRDMLVGKIKARFGVVKLFARLFEKVCVVGSYSYIFKGIFRREAVYVIPFLMKFFARQIYEIGRVVEIVGKLTG